jgi:hypothetical protein
MSDPTPTERHLFLDWDALKWYSESILIASPGAAGNSPGATTTYVGGRAMDTVRIPLTQGKFALVDAEWYPILNQWKWHHSCGYACRKIGPKGAKQMIRMHRFIMSAPEGMHVDHINHDRLDNRSQNLRVATPSENQGNRRLNKNSTTGYKGVHFFPDRNKYVATIRHNYKTHCLGYYETPEQAARAYNAAALERFGEFAWLNEVK